MSGIVWLCDGCAIEVFGDALTEETCLGGFGPIKCERCGNDHGRDHQFTRWLYEKYAKPVEGP